MPFITDSSTLADTITYTYDSTWSDKLASYNGQAITYDSLGNPLTYKGATLTWQGRNLMTYTTTEKRVEYTYNADNLRTTKDVYDSLGRITKSYTYTWADGKIIGYKVEVYSYEENATEPKGSIPLTIHYLYNESGEVYGFRLQNHSYAYVKDAFGSIVAIIDLETGSAVKELGYTAFGQLVDKTQVSTLTTDSADLSDAFDILHNLINNNISLLFGTLFFDNLWMDSTLIYKDYAYDSDTGMYYLQSRYYDPEVSRFINMDDTEILKVTVGTLNGANLFAYCNNDPVLNSDPSGYIKINIKWIDLTIDILLIVLPMVGQINSALSKAGKPASKIISKISFLFSKYYGKILKFVTKAVTKLVNRNLATKIAQIVCSGLFKAFSLFSVLSSIGNFIEYIIDCLDGKWDGYLDTNKNLKFRLVWKRGY